MDLTWGVRFTLSLYAYGFFFMDLFINLPMNGVWSLPGNWNKDSTISYGILAALILSIYLSDKYPIPWYISVMYIYLTIYTSHLHLMNFIPNSWITPPQVVVTKIEDPEVIDAF